MMCEHNYEAVGYNLSIVFEECTKCGNEREQNFDDYCAENGFPVIEEEQQ